MSIVLKDSEIKKLKKELTVEKLLEVITAQQKSQDEAINSVLKSINESLNVLKGFNAKIEAIAKDGKVDTAKLVSFQKDVAEAVKSLSKVSSVSGTSLTKTDLDKLVDKISSSIKSEDIVKSLNRIDKKLEDKPTEWKFQVIRDSRGRMKEINAKTKL